MEGDPDGAHRPPSALLSLTVSGWTRFIQTFLSRVILKSNMSSNKLRRDGEMWFSSRTVCGCVPAVQ